MKDIVRLTRATALLGILLLGGYLWWQSGSEEDHPVVVADSVTQAIPVEPAAMSASPAIRYPLETVLATAPLPTLQESDLPIMRALVALVGDHSWQTLFIADGIVRRIVATVDNLSRPEAPSRVWPVKPAGSWLVTVADGNTVILSPLNARRYARYAELLRALDIEQLANIYRLYYPLFQRAYVELGNPQGYFNDRLVATIDDLLATPEPTRPPRLVHVKVLYEFADPALERLSAGQKILLRVGPDTARLVKTKLAELRQAVTRPSPVR